MDKLSSPALAEVLLRSVLRAVHRPQERRNGGIPMKKTTGNTSLIARRHLGLRARSGPTPARGARQGDRAGRRKEPLDQTTRPRPRCTPASRARAVLLEEFPNDPLTLLRAQPGARYADVVPMFSAR